MAGWYPDRQSELIAWHAAFAASVSAYSVALGLGAPLVTQVGVDAATVASVINYLEQAQNFANEVTAFKDQVLHGVINTPNPQIPNVPAVLSLGLGWLANIEARTRQLVAQIKANGAYTAQMGQDMGIVDGSAPSGNVTVVATALTQSQIDIRVGKGGYAVVVLESRRAGGAWELIATLTTAHYVDNRAPLVPGQPEQREYRAQGFENNQRVGALSPVVSAVTVP
jgi:hypothetical protein